MIGDRTPGPGPPSYAHWNILFVSVSTIPNCA
jgi:hypothetical protein